MDKKLFGLTGPLPQGSVLVGPWDEATHLLAEDRQSYVFGDPAVAMTMLKTDGSSASPLTDLSQGRLIFIHQDAFAGHEGSDALIHALHRLSPADEAWDETTGFIGEQLEKGHAPEDVFAIQSRVLELHRWILNDAEYGSSPVLPESGGGAHRVFTADLAQPPQMFRYQGYTVHSCYE